MDSLSTHKTKAVKEWLAARSRGRDRFTPISASWINQIEQWFAKLLRLVAKHGVFRSAEELVDEIYRFIDYYNWNFRLYRWLKAADGMLASIERFQLHTAPRNMQRHKLSHNSTLP